ncbi:MAG TPA: winged helix DNA-binding domain-containing protein [Steroidobacteraceae bacterium]|nr:winged helix DNA-binding domain-containing protein [Steroidobacteraceae bacterium]
MKNSDLLRLRLHNQQLSETRSRRPRDVVSWLVAMQAQEYAMAKWAIGLRLPGVVSDADIERAFNAGEILRTHVLRPTWHFVAPADIRWLLELTAPRVHAASAYMYRKLELTAAVFKRSDAVLVRALRSERFLTRTALQERLARSGVKAEGPRLGYLMMHAELEGLICSGPREGRQFTYALLDVRAPGARPMRRESALAELSRRYFASRGPATPHDFANWSGLTVADARAGVESLDGEFVRQTIDGRTHVFRPANVSLRSATPFAFLMPDYDEFGMSYKDRRALATPGVGTLAYNRMIVVDGRIVGSWRRSLAGGSIAIETDHPARLSRARLRAVSLAKRRFTAWIDTAAQTGTDP